MADKLQSIMGRPVCNKTAGPAQAIKSFPTNPETYSNSISKPIRLIAAKGLVTVMRNWARHRHFNDLLNFHRKLNSYAKVGGLLGQLRVISICPGFIN